MPAEAEEMAAVAQALLNKKLRAGKSPIYLKIT
jgi:hypothetical protein